jgi:hypothetical protein
MSTALSTKIYADAYALSLVVFTRTKSIPRAHRVSLARGLEVSALELVFGVRQAGVVGMPAAKRNGCL